MNTTRLFTVTPQDLNREARVIEAEARLDESDIRLTWDLLAILEPQLKLLLEDAQAIRDDCESESFCANRHWYLELRPCLLKLVGWDRPGFHPILSTRQAYDLAYGKLYEPLPACRNCACL